MESLTNFRRLLGIALSTAVIASAVATSAAYAADANGTSDDSADVSSSALDCMGANSALPVDNQAVLALKTSTPNQYLARAHVAGTIGQIYADEHGHNHFELIIGSGPTDTIEIVYNISFGELPQLQAGMTSEVCGDFINSDAATSQYPESPDNAIIHWVHRNPKGRGHASGFVEIDGKVYGQGNGRGD